MHSSRKISTCCLIVTWGHWSCKCHRILFILSFTFVMKTSSSADYATGLFYGPLPISKYWQWVGEKWMHGVVCVNMNELKLFSCQIIYDLSGAKIFVIFFYYLLYFLYISFLRILWISGRKPISCHSKRWKTWIPCIYVT